MALEKWSMTTNMESALLDSGRLVTKSIVINFQISAGSGFGWREIWACGLFLVDWHVAHPST